MMVFGLVCLVLVFRQRTSLVQETEPGLYSLLVTFTLSYAQRKNTYKKPESAPLKNLPFQHIFVKHLLCSKHHSRCWRYSNQQCRQFRLIVMRNGLSEENVHKRQCNADKETETREGKLTGQHHTAGAGSRVQVFRLPGQTLLNALFLLVICGIC